MKNKLSENEIISFLAVLEVLDKAISIQAGLALSCSLFLDSELSSSFKVLNFITKRFDEEDVISVINDNPSFLTVLNKVVEEKELSLSNSEWLDYFKDLKKSGTQ